MTVSICTLTYNHEPYIRKCLDGLLMQKCNFPFEVLIHDDASTDNTANIIREYEAKHPNVIKPIYQTENQYSKGVSPTIKFQFPRAKGKYIAICEGDDYWTDPLKLQKQVDFMEENPNCKLCVTNARYFYQEKNKFKSFNVPEKEINRITRVVSLKYIFSKKGVVFPTASFMVRNDSLLNSSRFYELVNFLQLGDRAIQLNAICHGDICCLKDQTTVYRVAFKGDSWTSRNVNKFNVEKLNNAIKRKNKLHNILLENKFKEYKKIDFSSNISGLIISSGVKFSKIKQFKLAFEYFKYLKIKDIFWLVPRLFLK